MSQFFQKGIIFWKIRSRRIDYPSFCKKNAFFWTFWVFSAWMWSKLAAIYPNICSSVPFFRLASLFTTFLLGYGQKYLFRFWTREYSVFNFFAFPFSPFLFWALRFVWCHIDPVCYRSCSADFLQLLFSLRHSLFPCGCSRRPAWSHTRGLFLEWGRMRPSRVLRHFAQVCAEIEISRFWTKRWPMSLSVLIVNIFLAFPFFPCLIFLL